MRTHVAAKGWCQRLPMCPTPDGCQRPVVDDGFTRLPKLGPPRRLSTSGFRATPPHASQPLAAAWSLTGHENHSPCTPDRQAVSWLPTEAPRQATPARLALNASHHVSPTTLALTFLAACVQYATRGTVPHTPPPARHPSHPSRAPRPRWPCLAACTPAVHTTAARTA